MRHLLLPFTGTLDTHAIEGSIALARQMQATLVPLSLIRLPEQERPVRLEFIQQSQDFLETVKHKARRRAVPTEGIELYTQDITTSIRALAGEMCCTGTLLFLRQHKGVLLSIDEIKSLVGYERLSLFLVLLPASKPWWSFLTRKEKRSTTIQSLSQQPGLELNDTPYHHIFSATAS